MDQVVQFGENGHLRLSAAASVDAVNSPSRIDFTFDLAYFEIKATPLGPLPFGPFDCRIRCRFESWATKPRGGSTRRTWARTCGYPRGTRARRSCW